MPTYTCIFRSGIRTCISLIVHTHIHTCIHMYIYTRMKSSAIYIFVENVQPQPDEANKLDIKHLLPTSLISPVWQSFTTIVSERFHLRKMASMDDTEPSPRKRSKSSRKELLLRSSDCLIHGFSDPDEENDSPDEDEEEDSHEEGEGGEYHLSADFSVNTDENDEETSDEDGHVSNDGHSSQFTTKQVLQTPTIDAQRSDEMGDEDVTMPQVIKEKSTASSEEIV